MTLMQIEEKLSYSLNVSNTVVLEIKNCFVKIYPDRLISNGISTLFKQQPRSDIKTIYSKRHNDIHSYNVSGA